MSTQTQRNLLRTVVTATALVIMSGGLNIIVMKTLGSFDAATVILALYVGFWTFVLGSIGLVLSSLWLFMKGKVMRTDVASEQLEAHEHGPIGLQGLDYHRICAG